MALTTGTKTLVDATATQPDSAANALSHGADHKAIHAALKEVYGILRYKAIISQSGTSAPTVGAELENTTGATMTWSYVTVGQYRLTASSQVFLTANKTLVHITNGVTGNAYVILGSRSGASTVDLVISANSSISNASIVIEVYP